MEAMQLDGTFKTVTTADVGSVVRFPGNPNLYAVIVKDGSLYYAKVLG